MNYKKYILFPALFLSCTARLQKTAVSTDSENAVAFYRDSFKDYLWNDSSDDSKVHPRIIGINGIYPLEYRLNGSELLLVKHAPVPKSSMPTDVGKVLFRQTLPQAQQQEFQRVMRQLNMATVTDADAATATCVVEDGFE